MLLRRGNDQTGGAAVEFAILLPVLIAILFGTIEFGLAFYSQEVITNASREGARVGIVQASPKPTIGQIQAVVTAYASAAGIPLTASDVAVIGAGGVFPTPLTVTVTYQYNFLVLPTFAGLPSSINLSASTVMNNE